MLEEEAFLEDLSEFKKSVKGSESVNRRAASREMPDPSIVDRVRERGVNEAIRDHRPEWGTTIVRTKEHA